MIIQSENDNLGQGAYCFLDQLGVLYCRPKSILDISYSDELHPLDAECEQDGLNINILLSHRLSSNDELRALAHECVHVKQYIKKELVEIGNKIYWKGKETAYDVENYWSMPWEIEAYELESILIENFLHYK